jgi:hypothetical protein
VTIEGVAVLRAVAVANRTVDNDSIDPVSDSAKDTTRDEYSEEELPQSTDSSGSSAKISTLELRAGGSRNGFSDRGESSTVELEFVVST